MGNFSRRCRAVSSVGCKSHWIGTSALNECTWVIRDVKYREKLVERERHISEMRFFSLTLDLVFFEVYNNK